MTDVKIRCDDCKFVEDCVDYGWEGCRKFTPAPSKPMTNEEWFCSLPTDEKAKFMCDIYEMGKNGKEYFMRLDKAVEWLKQPHTPKE